MKGQRGFTIIEVLISIAILATISALLWSSFSQTVKVKQKVEAIEDRTTQVRTAVGRVARDLAMAYISDHEDPTISERRTQFVGRSRGGGVDQLLFSYMGHQRLYRDAAESETALVSYYGAPDPLDRRKVNLMRRETRRLQAVDPKQIAGESYILCEDVVRLKLSYYDRLKKQWRDEWSTLSADGEQYLPWRVRIELVVRDERDREVSYMTEAHILLPERIGWIPQ